MDLLDWGRWVFLWLRNFIKAGHEVIVYNRTRAKAERLGARVANTPADAARDAEVVITMLADDDAVREVVFGADGLANTLQPGAIHVSMSTISVATFAGNGGGASRT